MEAELHHRVHSVVPLAHITKLTPYQNVASASEEALYDNS